MSVKHRFKVLVREGWARFCWSTGLARLVDRCCAPRLVILYGHAVADDELNAHLAPPMKISPDKLDDLLGALGKRFDFVTVTEGMDRLRDGTANRSMVALSMDDGYRDNLLRLVPILERHGARATIFLEAGAVVDRTLPWLHALEWLAEERGPVDIGARLAKVVPTAERALRESADAESIKRILKYDADESQRDEALGTFLDEEDADRAELLDKTYLSHDEARQLAAHAAIEIGGHTIRHPVLSRLGPDEQRAEIEGGRARLQGLLSGTLGDEMEDQSAGGDVFAYPFGRDWDFDQASVDAAAGAGYRYAVTTMTGANVNGSDAYRLCRWPIDDSSRLHLIGTEASGGFQLWRKFGVELTQS